eukprot:5672619-Prymnesium_polylepis.1
MGGVVLSALRRTFAAWICCLVIVTSMPDAARVHRPMAIGNAACTLAIPHSGHYSCTSALGLAPCVLRFVFAWGSLWCVSDCPLFITDWGVLLRHGNSCGFCMAHYFNASSVTQHPRSAARAPVPLRM